MTLAQSIQQYGETPIPHHVMTWLLQDYRQPNDKIQYLVKDGLLLPVRKGLYVAGPKITHQQPDPFLLANHILGPSYVSLESALSYYDLIPEKVYETTSVTTKGSRIYQTPLGVFSYTRLRLPYYSYGIASVAVSPKQRFLVATPEKALFDKIIATAGVELRSRKGALAYLENDLRIDLDRLKTLNVPAMKEWLVNSPKRTSLDILVQTIQQL
ncbi:hypothetical protein [Chitinophaga sp. XS-30]|uniref:type IV toxin-antitoxin system AbiEi family antitoxin domain-containing protein n=1 Tax=Chitinophaga sp. XS-30 TaxID=2604421 RepID=UPI001AEFFB9F|nr:hypothetical protein [Chitinophaga sp. XS-30]